MRRSSTPVRGWRPATGSRSSTRPAPSTRATAASSSSTSSTSTPRSRSRCAAATASRSSSCSGWPRCDFVAVDSLPESPRGDTGHGATGGFGRPRDLSAGIRETRTARDDCQRDRRRIAENVAIFSRGRKDDPRRDEVDEVGEPDEQDRRPRGRGRRPPRTTTRPTTAPARRVRPLGRSTTRSRTDRPRLTSGSPRSDRDGAAPRGQRAGAADHQSHARADRRVRGPAPGLRRPADRGRLDRHPQRDRRRASPLRAARPRSSTARSARSC